MEKLNLLFLITTKILPLYALIALGFFAGKVLKVQKDNLSPLLIYILTPVVIFTGLLKATLTIDVLLLPLIVFLVASLICLLVLWSSRCFFNTPLPNLLAFSAGNANNGYFGIPVGIALFGSDALPLIILCGFGFLLYENTVGIYVLARGRFNVRESLIKILKLPSIYAFSGGLIANVAGLSLPPEFIDVTTAIRGAYAVLGMMIVGLAMAELPRILFDITFVATACLTRFVLWPLLGSLALTLCIGLGMSLPDEAVKIFRFMCALPIAANIVVWASFFNIEPEKAAVAVLVSTLLSPLVLAYY